MKRVFTLLIILALLLPLAMLSGCSQEQDLIKNGDLILRDKNGEKIMEDGSVVNYKLNADENGLPVDWNVFTSDSADLSNADYTSNTVYVGRDTLAELGQMNKNYITFRHTSNVYSSATQRVRVNKNTDYTFSFQYKIEKAIYLTSGGSTSSGLSAVIMEEERYLYTGVTEETGDWQTYTVTFNSGNHSVLNIGIRMGLGYMQYNSVSFSKASGTAHVTDISLKRTEAANPHVVGTDDVDNLIENEAFIKKDNNLVRQKTQNSIYFQYEDETVLTEVFALDTTGWKLNSTGDTTVSASHAKSSHYNKNYINCILLNLKGSSATATTRVKVEKNTTYRFSYAYWVMKSIDGGNGILSFGAGSQPGYGVRPVILSDRLYRPVDRSSSNYDWTTETIYFNTGSQNYIDIGVAVGDAKAPVTGYVRVTNFILDKYDTRDVKTPYVISSYTGDGESKTGGWILVGCLTFAALILCAFSFIMLSLKSAKIQASAKAGAVIENAEQPLLKSEPVREEVKPQVIPATVDNDFGYIAKAKNISLKVLHSPVFLITIILSAAFLLRLLLAYSVMGLREDLTLYTGYADNLKRYALDSFYQNNLYINPPLYVYLMKFITLIFGGVNTSSLEFSVIFKLPSILADLSTAVIIYFLAKKYCNKSWAAVLAFLYAFNPLTLMDSALWGQSESVAALFIVAAFYFLVEKKYAGVFIFYTLALLTGISALIAAPVFIAYFTFIWVKSLRDLIRTRRDNELLSKKLTDTKYRSVWLLPLYAIGSYVLIYLLCLPFSSDSGIFTPVVQFFYENIKASTLFGNNIFNLFGLFGKNMEKFTYGAGMTAIMISFGVVMIALSALIYIFRRNRANMVLCCALVYILTIQFMVNMTPRYYVIAGAVLLIAFALIRDRRILHSYMMISAVGIFNMGAILASANSLNRVPTVYLKNIIKSLTSSEGVNLIMILGSLFALLTAVYVIYTAVDIFVRDRRVPIKTLPDNRFSEAMKNYFKSF